MDVGRVPLAGDWRSGVRVSAEDHSDGAPLEGDPSNEWRAHVLPRPPRRRKLGKPLLCAKSGCFCARSSRVGEGAAWI